MNRLTQEQAAAILAKVNGDPCAELEDQLDTYRGALWFYESWVAALELKLNFHGIDPSLEVL